MEFLNKPQLTDPQELNTLCRDSRVRELFKEAVSSYHAGAFRSAIIMSWIVLVFDYVYKLEELGLRGDKQAEEAASKFHEWHEKKDTRKLLDFENEVLKNCQEVYQFISLSERLDLERLQMDRHRCAHPSISKVSEPFAPSAELARYHMRNVVEVMCQHPPTQGRSGFDELWRLIELQSFPSDWEAAKKQLQASPLLKLRESARRSFIISLIKTPIKEKKSYSESKKIFSVLRASLELLPGICDDEMQRKINVIFEAFSDDERLRSIVALQMAPVLVQILLKTELDKIKTLIGTFDPLEKYGIICCAAAVPELFEATVPLIEKMDMTGINSLLEIYSSDFSFDKAISYFASVARFDDADSAMARLIIPNAKRLSADHIRRILIIARTNSQIYGACSKMPDLFKEFFLLVQQSHYQLKDEWVEFRDFIFEKYRGRSWIPFIRTIDATFSQGPVRSASAN